MRGGSDGMGVDGCGAVGDKVREGSHVMGSRSGDSGQDLGLLRRWHTQQVIQQMIPINGQMKVK